MNATDIKPGDSVWIGNRHSPQRNIVKVARLTETQIITFDGLRESRYLRKNGSPVNRVNSYWITGIATENDIKGHEAARRALLEQSAAALNRSKLADEKRQELNAIFNGRAFVRKEGDGWAVEFEPMPEAEVQLLAKKITS